MIILSLAQCRLETIEPNQKKKKKMYPEALWFQLINIQRKENKEETQVASKHTKTLHTQLVCMLLAIAKAET